jgi:hypothetical protein
MSVRFLGRPLHEYAFAFALFAFSIGYFWMSFGYPRDAREVPQLVGAALVTLSALDLVSMTNLGVARWLRRINPTSAPDAEHPKSEVGRELKAGGVVLGFVVLIYLVGVIAAIGLYVAGSMLILGRMRLLTCIVTAALVAGFCYVLFDLALDIDLYRGVILSVAWP